MAQAREGHGQVVCIAGEPGMGKSRLVHEFKARAAGFVVFEAYSASHGKASPYLPITELLKGFFQIQLTDDEQTRREKVIGKLLGLDRNLEAVLPYYYALLNIDDAESPLPQMDPQLRRRRTFEALRQVTLRASLEQPLLVIFEDLHWIDSETQGFLDGLVESLGSARILLLTNYRPEYRQDWGTKSYCTQLRLAPFGRTEAEEFLGILLGEPRDLQKVGTLDNLRHWILEKTEGTPFFMEEVVQELFEQQHLQRDLSGRLLLPTLAMTQIQIPTTVQGVLAARIDRLSPDEKRLLQQLAVIGREFPLSLAQAAVDVSEGELHPLLQALQKKEFLYEQPAFPEVEYLFKHALTQEVAYHSLLQETRKVIHEKTAFAIETAYQSELEDHYGALAHHYSRSGNVEKALDYSRFAGNQAYQRSAHRDAVAYFQTALALIPQLSGDEQEQTELPLLLALAAPLMSTRGIASIETLALYRRAQILSEKIGSIEERCTVLAGLRIHYAVRGDQVGAVEHARNLLSLVLSTNNSELQGHAYVSLGIQEGYRGSFSAAVRNLETAWPLYDFAQDRHRTPRYGWDWGLACLANFPHSLFALGYPDQAEEKVELSLTHAARLNYPYMTVFALQFAVITYQMMRQPHLSLSHAEAALALAAEHNFPEWTAWGHALRGWARSNLNLPGAADEIRHGVALAAQIGAGAFHPVWMAALAEASLNDGDFAGAAAAIAEGLATSNQYEERWFDAELYRIRGDLACQQDGSSTARHSAEQDYLCAVEIAQAQEAKSWELRATLGLARLWVAQGRAEEALARLASLQAWFTEGFDTPDLREARKLSEPS